VLLNDESDDEEDEEEEPQTLRSAINSDARDNWLAAVRSELSSHRKNGTWSPSAATRACGDTLSVGIQAQTRTGR
jgi:hypothetical protein